MQRGAVVEFDDEAAVDIVLSGLAEPESTLDGIPLKALIRFLDKYTNEKGKA